MVVAAARFPHGASKYAGHCVSHYAGHYVNCTGVYVMIYDE
jgi:hypothetical protein